MQLMQTDDDWQRMLETLVESAGFPLPTQVHAI